MPGSLFLINGRIFPDATLENEGECCLIGEDGILGFGKRDEVEPLASGPVSVFDLQGRTVFPAFSDNLARVRKTAMTLDWIDLSNKTNITEVFAAVEKSCLEKPPETWVCGYGWNLSQWGWHRLPHRADLDLVAPHHPVLLYSGDFRIVWLNTAAIQKTGITHSTPHPPGGEIERDEVTGSATGIFKEFAADFLEEKIPPLQSTSLGSRVDEVIRRYLAMGVTALESFGDLTEMEVLREVAERGELPIEVTVHLPYSEHDALIERGWRTGTAFGNLRVGGLWLAVDGNLVSQTALLLEPYGDDWDRFGVEIADRARVDEMLDCCLANRFSPVLIASGDAACRTVLRALHARKSEWHSVHPQLVHGLLVRPEDLRLVEGTGLGLTVNPRRLITDKEVGEVYLGSRWKEILNLSAWENAGAKIQFGSGEPLSQWNPLTALSYALKRPSGCGELTRREGVASLIRSVGHGENGNRGWVVLSENPMEVPDERIDRIRVHATIGKRGEILFEEDPSDS